MTAHTGDSSVRPEIASALRVGRKEGGKKGRREEEFMVMHE